jgi:hypothetical protein
MIVCTACPETRREPRSTCPHLIGKIPARSAPTIPAPSESVAQLPRRPLAPFLGLAPTCPEETRGIPHSPSPLLLLTNHCPLTCPDMVATLSGSLPTIPLNPLDATLMCLPASVANKRLTPQLNHLDATLTKNRGYLLQAKSFSLSSPRRLFLSLPPILRILFQVPYPVSPLFATLTKTPGVWGYSSHFGTRARKDHGRVLLALRFQLSIEDPGTVGYGQNLQSSVGTSVRSCRRRCK